MRKKLFIRLTILIGITISISACDSSDSPMDKAIKEHILSSSSSIMTLTADTLADGEITSYGGDQWFKFTATASTQYIHVSFGTLKYLTVNVYNSRVDRVHMWDNEYSSSSDSIKYKSWSVTVGQEYYIRVSSSRYANSTGTYKIGFNTTPYPPGTIQLTANTWADGEITSYGGDQWFKFTATASTQYIRASFGTLTNLYVQVYNSSGTTVGNNTNLSSSTRCVFMTVTLGQEYYIRVMPYNSSGSGTYKITLNTSSTPPS